MTNESNAETKAGEAGEAAGAANDDAASEGTDWGLHERGLLRAGGSVPGVLFCLVRDQNRKYFCAKGRTRAGSQVSS